MKTDLEPIIVQSKSQLSQASNVVTVLEDAGFVVESPEVDTHDGSRSFEFRAEITAFGKLDSGEN